MIEELAFTGLGILAGIVTGLLPGVHANTIAVIALYSPLEKNLSFAMFIVAMSITHSFLDAIPTILLGAPTEESSINVLPGHEMLLKGRGLEAIQLTIFGGAATMVFAVLLSPLFYSFAKNYAGGLPAIIPAAIALTIALLIFGEKNRKAAAVITLLAGACGALSLNSGIKEAIFALVVGFFGLPGLIEASTSKPIIPAQEKNFDAKEKASVGFISALASGLLAIFPGIGPSQAATLVNTFAGKMSRSGYLVMSGGINAGNLFFSILMLFALEKTRTGMAAALDATMKINFGDFLVLTSTAVLSAGCAILAAEKIAGSAVDLIQKVDYAKISRAAMVFMVALVALFTGIAGLVACASAASIALAGRSWGLRRSHCMAFLLVPTFLFYIGL